MKRVMPCSTCSPCRCSATRNSAADQFASYMLLRMGKDDARQLVLGATYTFRAYMDASETTESTIGFSDIHGTPAQRFFNLLCIGYGARPDVFGDLGGEGTTAEIPCGRLRLRVRRAGLCGPANWCGLISISSWRNRFSMRPGFLPPATDPSGRHMQRRRRSSRPVGRVERSETYRQPRRVSGMKCE